MGVLAAAAVVAVVAGYAAHRFRARREMQAEIQAILRQYMPLEAEADDGLGLGGAGAGSARPSDGGAPLAEA